MPLYANLNRPAFMSWITVIWSMIVAVCLTLALGHVLIWWRRRQARANALFALMAVATALEAVGEVWLMRAQTPAQFGLALRWLHVPAWAIIVLLVGFVRIYLHAGRRWLGWTVCGLRSVSLLLNFCIGTNLNFWHLTALRRISFLGEWVAAGVGTPNPWMLVGQASFVLLVVFGVDAGWTVWRRGERRQALVVGGSIVFFIAMGSAQAILVLWGLLPMPITASWFFMGLVVAMGFELSREMLRAADLSDELRASEQRMTLAAEATNLGLWLWDVARDEIWATPRWRLLFGFGTGERISFGDLLGRVHGDDREGVARVLRSAAESHQPYEVHCRLALPDGEERWIIAAGRMEDAVCGTVPRMHGLCRDITARQRAERELHERRAELLHLSRVAMLGELSGSLAHELNQPLTAILSNAQAAQRFLAQDPPNLAELGEILADIVAEDVRAGEVIRRLHLLLKKGEVQKQALDINEVVLEVIQIVRNDLANHSVTVETDLAPELATICGDRVQLQQVLLNLVMNACDAMAGTVPNLRRLTLRTRSLAANAVRIEVCDVGCGLPGGGSAQPFERFFTTKPHGHGLGLSVCRTILAAHDGTLGASNNTGPGATFHCTLPSSGEGRGASGEGKRAGAEHDLIPLPSATGPSPLATCPLPLSVERGTS